MTIETNLRLRTLIENKLVRARKYFVESGMRLWNLKKKQFRAF